MKLASASLVKITRRFGTRPKVSIDLDKNVVNALETEKYKMKKHEGIIGSNAVYLPESVVKRIRQCTADHPFKSLVEKGEELKKHLHSRHLPMESFEFNRKMEDAALLTEEKSGVDVTKMTAEERLEFRKNKSKRILKEFKLKTYMWKAINYNEFQSKAYLLGKSAANYAVLHKIFLELKKREPDFLPKTLFDFGSGVGTVTWAAKEFWKDSIKEYFCVDSSSDMNDLASLILQDKSNLSDERKGYFFRQFLPVSHSLQYDIVVSAFSLFELPSLKSRLETILTLWRKTKHFLIIVEQGSNAGFQVINEARDFVLEYSNNPENESSNFAHVFSPCPHDVSCPRFVNDFSPCNFEVRYFNPFGSKPEEVKRERYSYVVLRKGPRSLEDKQWPRLIRGVLPRSRHVVCRICTAKGTLEEVVVTPSKHGKLAYKCARSSKWGDMLPFILSNKELSEKEDSDNGVNMNIEQSENVSKEDQ